MQRISRRDWIKKTEKLFITCGSPFSRSQRFFVVIVSAAVCCSSSPRTVISTHSYPPVPFHPLCSTFIHCVFCIHIEPFLTDVSGFFFFSATFWLDGRFKIAKWIVRDFSHSNVRLKLNCCWWVLNKFHFSQVQFTWLLRSWVLKYVFIKQIICYEANVGWMKWIFYPISPLALLVLVSGRTSRVFRAF